MKLALQALARRFITWPVRLLRKPSQRPLSFSDWLDAQPMPGCPCVACCHKHAAEQAHKRAAGGKQ